MPETTLTKEEIDVINAKQLLTVKETAVFLGINRQTVYRLIYAGELPVCKVGRSSRILREDIQKYIKANIKGGR